MRDRLTDFGKRCRELRTRYSLVMADQARGLGISIAYISAIERGKRPLPEDYPTKLAQWMSLSEDDSADLVRLAFGEKKVVKVFPEDPERAVLAHEFAIGLNGLSSAAIIAVRELLATSKSSGYTNDEIRERALVSRTAFNLGNKITIDILKVIENYLPLVDPDFFLQVNADGSEIYQQIYSDSDGEKVDRVVMSEWQCNAAYREIDSARFTLAHEIAHWLLHRNMSHTFFRLSRGGRIPSKYLHVELEADLFARELLMPLDMVDKSASAEVLSRVAKVPVWVAKKRIAEVERLSDADRIRISRVTCDAESRMRSVASDANVSSPVAPKAPIAAQPIETATSVVRFPTTKAILERRAQIKAKRSSKPQSTLPLFDYAEAISLVKNRPAACRSDGWFDEFGYRG